MTDPLPDPATVPNPVAAAAAKDLSIAQWEPPAVSAKRRAAAVTLAIIPGVAVRGLGGYLVEQSTASKRLLATTGIGVGMFLLGGIPLGATYGSGKVVVPGVHVVVAGAGLVFGSWWSDIYVAAGGPRLGGGPRALPDVEVELATLWQHDAFRGDRFFLRPAAGLRFGRIVGRSEAYVTDDASAFGGRLELGVRLWTRRGDASAAHARHSGSYIEARTALQALRERDDHLTLVTGELELRGRLDLALLDRGLRGAFFDLGEGLGLETATYESGVTDVNTLLLSRFAWGIYLPCRAGELSVFYDHRRDHLAGGFPAGRAAGFFGSLGASTEIVLSERWVLVGQLEIGSSWVTTFGLRREGR